MTNRERPAVVYLVTNTENGKRYIGVTAKRLCERRASHLNEARKGASKCRKFHAALRKYGSEAFVWTVLSTIASRTLAALEEIRLIAEIKPEYNLTAGGEGAVGIKKSTQSIEKQKATRAGWRPTEEQRKRQSEAQRGKKRSPETCARLSEIARRRTLSPVALANIRATQSARAGWKHTADARAKMSASRKGRKRPEHVTAKIIATRAARREARKAA